MYLLPIWQKKLNCPLTPAGLLPAALIVVLLLAACGSSAWNLSIDETPYTTTVTGIVQDALRTGFVGLPGVIISAKAATPTPITTTTGSDGSYSLKVTHSGSFTLKMAKTCYQAVPTKTITATSSGPYYAKTIRLTPVPEPTGNYRFTLKQNPGTAASATYTLTVKCGVREITPNEFRVNRSSSILYNRLGTNSHQRVTVIKLPESLIRIGDAAFADHQRMSRELTIPPTVEYIGTQAFINLSLQSSSSEQWVRLTFAPNSKLRLIEAGAFANAKLQQFPRLPQSLEELKSNAFLNVTHKPISNFTIPENVKEVGNRAFETTSGGVFQTFRGTLTIKSPHLVRTPVDKAIGKTGRLGNLFSTATVTSLFSQIILHKSVFDTYTQAELNAIFGTGARYVDLADRTTELTP